MISDILKENSNKPIQLVVGLDDLKAIISEVITEASRRKEILDHVSEMEEVPDTERYLSKATVIELLQISPSTLWRWTKLGLLKKYKIGGKPVYKGSELTKFIEEHGSRII